MQEEKFSYKNTIFRWIAAKVIRHGIKQSQHGKNNVRKTGGNQAIDEKKLENKKQEERENKRKRKGYKQFKVNIQNK